MLGHALVVGATLPLVGAVTSAVAYLGLDNVAADVPDPKHDDHWRPPSLRETGG